ncbi:transglutaminase domain-containing protein, partial [bacterium]|nr:transglutaminase domain-containing protein [bacterium]
IASRVAELTRGLSSREDKARAIFLDVATEVRNVHIPLGLGGYAPNNAEQVLENKYADTRDKAVLLTSMLRAAGIDAFPALVAGGSDARFTESVPTLKQFTRILVALPDGDSYRFLDPFMDDVSYGFVRWGRGNTCVVVRDDGSSELVQIPGFRASENHARKSMAIAMDSDGNADVRASCELTGYFDRKARRDLKDATPSEAQKLFDTAANVVSTGASDADHSHSDLTDLTEPVTVLQNIEAEGFAVRQGDMMIVRLPPFPHSFASTGLYPSLAERRYAFEFPCEFGSDIVLDLSLPDGYEVAWLPEDVTLITPDAVFKLTCESYEDQRTVVWTRSITVNERSISVDSYGEFKENYDTLSSPKNRLILLKKI